MPRKAQQLGLKPAIIEKCALVVKAVKPDRPFLLEIEEGDELKQAVVKRGLQEAARILNRHLLIRRKGKTMLVLRQVSQPEPARQPRKKGRPASGSGGKTTKKRVTRSAS